MTRNRHLRIFQNKRLNIPKFQVPDKFRDSVEKIASIQNFEKIQNETDVDDIPFLDFKSCIDRSVKNDHNFKIFNYQYCETCELYKNNINNQTGSSIDAQQHRQEQSDFDDREVDVNIGDNQSVDNFLHLRWYTQIAQIFFTQKHIKIIKNCTNVYQQYFIVATTFEISSKIWKE